MHRFLFMGTFLVRLTSCTSTLSSSLLTSQVFPFDITPKHNEYSDDLNQSAFIDVLCSKGLKLTDLRGQDVTELSGLSWDEDEKILYAIGDEGRLYHLELIIKGSNIKSVKVISDYPFEDKQGNPLTEKWRDTEGLSSQYHNNSITGDTELVVSFEGKSRVVRYTPKGVYIAEVKLPAKLWNKKNYRSKNKGLESVTVHPEEGIITAAEFPLKGKIESLQTLYASSGKSWDFTMASAKGSAVTGLEVLSNGNMLVLERAWAGIGNPIVITLAEVLLTECKSGEHCNVRELASLSSADGWMLDNFEGLAHYRDNLYLMISDDNDKKFQTTVLVLFSVNQKSQ